MTLKGYIFSRTFMGERVPQFVQNLVIRDYCQKNNFNFLMSATEYAMNKSALILKQLLKNELIEIQGIVMYSIFQLPEIEVERLEFLDDILKLNKQVHFALENLSVKNINDKIYINEIWGISQNMIEEKEFSILKKN